MLRLIRDAPRKVFVIRQARTRPDSRESLEGHALCSSFRVRPRDPATGLGFACASRGGGRLASTPADAARRLSARLIG
jgi:hypothetical protein